ncbi:MAG: ABC transporter ATP-binding protein [Candidatus Krumholzibacteriia bacterium]
MAEPLTLPDPPDLRLDDPAGFDGIALQGVDKRFGSKTVLDELDLWIRRGETIVIIGRSGEGKSVLLKHIVRLLEPDRGQIWVEGQEVTAMHRPELMELRKKFGMLFQGSALFDSMSVCDNVGFMVKEHSGWSEQRVRERACECLAMVGLEASEEKLPSALSGGMKKRAGLARAIAMEPQYILYDEPTTGLDPITADAINDLIIKLQRELQVTSVVVTHDMQSAFKVADRIAMLRQGRIVYVGTVQELETTDHPMVRQFIAGSAQGPLGAF